jgi:alpha-L-rhamnosidase
MGVMTSSSQSIATPRPLVVETIDPHDRREIAPGAMFFDFGKAAFGTLQIQTESAKAGRAVVHLGEKLDDAGRIDREPPGTIRYRAIPVDLPAGRSTTQIVIPPDERNTQGAAVLMPDDVFEVLPFRYAEIECGSDVRVSNFHQLAVFYPFDDHASDFRSNDDRLNRIWDLCKYSIKVTSFCGVYVDGDRERIPYEGDAYINQLCHYGVDAEYELARHSLEYLLFHPTWPTEWSLHCVPMAWADYQYTGNADLLEAYYDLLQRKALLWLAREDGLINTEARQMTADELAGIHLPDQRGLRDLVDWPPGSFTEGGTGERDNYDMVPVKTAVNAFYIWNLAMLERIAGVLGREDDQQRFSAQRSQATDALHRICFDRERGIFVDGQGSDHASLHANMLPAAMGLVPAGFESSVMQHIRSRGMACSVYGAQYLLEACYQLGDADHALALMTAEHDRGWLNMLNVGSTVTLEAWDHRYKNNLDWNHAWGAAPANILPMWLAGVRPATPGFGKAIIAPQPAGLTHLQVKVPTPHGPIALTIESGQAVIDTPVPAHWDGSGLGHEKGPTQLEPGRHVLDR